MPAKGGLQVDDIARRHVYVEHRIAGVYPTQAARLAGYKNPEESAKDLEKHPEIREIIASNIENSRIEARYTRSAVLEVIEDAIGLAKIIADPSSMIRGAQEINKMQGYYAVETKQLIISGEVKERIDQIQNMSEQDLLDRLGKSDAYIDAEFEKIADE